MRKVTFLVGIILLLGPIFCFSQEKITITTYYPSPYGSYRELNVGSGITSQVSTLHVRSEAFDLSNSPDANLRVDEDTAVDADVGGSIALGGQWNTGQYTAFAKIKAGKETAGAGNAAGYLAFCTSSSAGGALNEHMRIDSTGSVGIVDGQFGSDIYVIGSSGSTETINWNNGNTQHITLTANCSISFSNPISGRKYTLIIKQDGSGLKTISWPGTVRWPGGTAPTLTTTANKTDYIGFIYNSVDSRYDGIAQQLNF